MSQSFSKGKSAFGNVNNVGNESDFTYIKKQCSCAQGGICINNCNVINSNLYPNNKNSLQSNLFYTQDLNNVNVMCSLDQSNNQVLCNNPTTINPNLFQNENNPNAPPFYFQYNITFQVNSNCGNYTNFSVLSNTVCNIPYPIVPNSSS